MHRNNPNSGRSGAVGVFCTQRDGGYATAHPKVPLQLALPKSAPAVGGSLTLYGDGVKFKMGPLLRLRCRTVLQGRQREWGTVWHFLHLREYIPASTDTCKVYLLTHDSSILNLIN